MRMLSHKTLAYYKEKFVTLRQLIEEFTGSAAHLKELKNAFGYAKKKIEKIEGKVLVCVLLLVLAGGCLTHTVDGFGRFVGGIGDDISQAATGYENETNK